MQGDGPASTAIPLDSTPPRLGLHSPGKGDSCPRMPVTIFLFLFTSFAFQYPAFSTSPLSVLLSRQNNNDRNIDGLCECPQFVLTALLPGPGYTAPAGLTAVPGCQ